MEKYVQAVRLLNKSFDARRHFCKECPFLQECDTLPFGKCEEVQAYCLKNFLENYEKSSKNA
jgi:hypothetical protein